MEETNMDIALLVILAIASVGFFLTSAMAPDETMIELSDEEAEEYRKKLIEQEEKDVELDKE